MSETPKPNIVRGALVGLGTVILVALAVRGIEAVFDLNLGAYRSWIVAGTAVAVILLVSALKKKPGSEG